MGIEYFSYSMSIDLSIQLFVYLMSSVCKYLSLHLFFCQSLYQSVYQYLSL